MQFARVSGFVVADDNMLLLTVSLDTGRRVETVRSERVPRLGSGPDADDLNWQANQYTQETIGNELTLLGWEPLAEEPSEDSPSGTGVSASFLVRKMGGAS